MKVLVVGSTGYIGRHLGAHLRARGDYVIASSSTDGTGIDPDTGLFSENFTVPAGMDAVCYLAQSPRYREGTDHAWHVMNVNVVSAARVAALACRAGVKRFVYASTGNVYAPAFTAHGESSPVRRDRLYELSKVQAEETLALFRDRLEVTAVRLFGVYGPGQSARLLPNLAGSIAAGKPVLVERNPGDPSDLGGLRISLCYIEDVVAILAALLGHESAPAINVAGNEVLNIQQIATAIGNALGRDARIEVAERPREGDLIADIHLLKRLLQPRFTPFATGLLRALGMAGS